MQCGSKPRLTNGLRAQSFDVPQTNNSRSQSLSRTHSSIWLISPDETVRVGSPRILRIWEPAKGLHLAPQQLTSDHGRKLFVYLQRVTLKRTAVNG